MWLMEKRDHRRSVVLWLFGGAELWPRGRQFNECVGMDRCHRRMTTHMKIMRINGRTNMDDNEGEQRSKWTTNTKILGHTFPSRRHWVQNNKVALIYSINMCINQS